MCAWEGEMKGRKCGEVWAVYIPMTKRPLRIFIGALLLFARSCALNFFVNGERSCIGGALTAPFRSRCDACAHSDRNSI